MYDDVRSMSALSVNDSDAECGDGLNSIVCVHFHVEQHHTFSSVLLSLVVIACFHRELLEVAYIIIKW